MSFKSLKELGIVPSIEYFIMHETGRCSAQIAIQQHKDVIRGIQMQQAFQINFVHLQLKNVYLQCHGNCCTSAHLPVYPSLHASIFQIPQYL